MKQKFFKKNTSARFALCLLLFAPLIVAVIFGFTTDPNSVTANSLRTVEITPPGKNTYEFTDEGILDLYSDITKGSKQIEEGFRDFSLEEPYTIAFTETNSEPLVYKFYASTKAEDCVYVSPDGKYFLVSPSVAEKIIKREEFASIDTERLLPELTLSALQKDIKVMADTFSWTYTALDGSVYTVKESEVPHNPVIKFDDSDDGEIVLGFDRQPDLLKVEIKDKDEVLFSDKYENLKSATNLSYDHDKKLDMLITAEWYEIEGADHFGNATYHLDLLYDVEPEYRMVNKTLPTGEFTVLNIKNFNDGEMLGVSGELGLPESMKVYDYKDIKIALIPLSSVLEPKDYNLKLTTELGQTGSAKINVARREEYDSQTLIINDGRDPGLNEAFTREAIDEFEALIKKHTLDSANEQLFEGKKFDYPTGSTKLAKGGARYGMEREVMSLNADGIKLTSYGQDMECKEGQDIKAANSGKVVFAGETKLFGGTVIIDHGYGILSYYGNMESLTASENSDIKKGDVIGKAGSTGFACTLDGVNAKTTVLCHYAVSMNGVFIAPRSIYNGIYLS